MASPETLVGTAAVSVLVRHPEALKNTKVSFGGEASDDQLTESGAGSAGELARQMRIAFSDTPTRLLTSPATRAQAQAEAIGAAIGAVPTELGGLESIDTGALSGVTERHAWELFPAYMRRLALYRAGLLNGYDLLGPGETLACFEERVVECVGPCRTGHPSLSVIVAHRSTITAILMLAARELHGFPSGFYGYVELPASSISVINWTVGIASVGLTKLDSNALREMVGGYQ